MINGHDVNKILDKVEATIPEQPDKDTADKLRGIAVALDQTFNPPGTLIRDRRGYFLMVFPVAAATGKLNFVTSVPEATIIELMRRQVAKYDDRQRKIAEGTSAVPGHA